MWQRKYILSEMGSSLHCPAFVTDGNPPVKSADKKKLKYFTQFLL